MFFADEKNTEVLGSFLRRIEAEHIDDEIRKKRLSHAKRIIKSIYNSPKDWDEHCDFNIRHIGDSFLDSMRNIDLTKPMYIDNIYASSYRFLREYDFFVDEGKELNFELRTIVNSIQDDNHEMEEHSGHK